jgi:two-component system sensor histidine kinase YesM
MIANQSKQGCAMPLYVRLLLSFLIAILVPSLFVGIFSYQQVSKAIEDEVSSSVKQTIHQVNLNLDTHLRQAVELSTVVYINLAVQRILSRQSPASYADLQDDVRELREDLVNVTRYQELYTVRLYYRDIGQFPSGFEVEELQNISLLKDSSINPDALANNNGMKWTTDQVPQARAGSESRVTLAREVRNMSDESFLGVMTISLPERKLWDIIKDVKIGDSGFVFIINESGKVVSHHNKELLGENLSSKEYVSKIMGNDAGDFLADLDGEQYLFVFQTIEGTPWKLVGFNNTKELWSKVDAIRVATILIALVCFGLAILYSIYTSGWLAKRVGNLIKAMRKIENGELGTQLKNRRRSADEITQLYSHFNRMSSELKQHVETIELTNAKIRKAELKALQQQINPHFLYNTLDSINWMAATRYRATDISIMVTSLANLFRLSLNMSNEMTSVQREIEHVRCYVTIQKVRFDNEFDLQVDIEEGLENTGVIKLILQPLVENAIIHGFEGIDYPGLIHIKVRRQGYILIIDVRDNGIGCDTEYLNRLLEEEDPASPERTGYGLYNVNERIRLYYGPPYGLHYKRIDSGESGTHVQVSLLWPSEEKGESYDQDADSG